MPLSKGLAEHEMRKCHRGEVLICPGRRRMPCAGVAALADLAEESNEGVMA